MELVGLQDEIEKIKAEIKEKCDMQQIFEHEMEELKLRERVLKAQLIGLKQQLKALTEDDEMGEQRGASSVAQAPSTSDLTKLTLVDAVECVINESAEPMQIADVRRRLRKLGRDDDGASVGVTLPYLVTNQRSAE